ncbi:MAG: Holliday junction resolvase RuvX, partial [Gammaproteobacteria bacterium]
MSDTREINTLLCFDFGTKRIGVAVGQFITQTATPLETVKNKNKRPDWDHIKRL